MQHDDQHADGGDHAATQAPTHGRTARGLKPGQSAAFRAFRALRQLRPDRAYGALGQAAHTRGVNAAVLGRLRTAAAAAEGGDDKRGALVKRGRKRQAAKRALRAAYHGVVGVAMLPLAYVVAAAFPEGHAATSSSLTLSTLANAPGNALSRWFGYMAASRRVPSSLHHRMIRMMVRVYGIDISQVEKPIEAYPTLQDFFSRRLQPGARPAHPSALLVSPCDGELLRVGPMDSASVILQVKGNAYPVEQLTMSPMPPVAAGHKRWFYLFHLRPKDYHRFHAPCDAQVMEAVHVPGCLFPVTQTATKWIPNLFAESERVAVVARRTADGQPIAIVPMGATCVGSISLAFDGSLRTNTISSWTNLRSLFRWRPGGDRATSAAAAAGQQRVPLLGSGWEYDEAATRTTTEGRMLLAAAAATTTEPAEDDATPTAASTTSALVATTATAATVASPTSLPFHTSPWHAHTDAASTPTSDPTAAASAATAPAGVLSPPSVILTAKPNVAQFPVLKHSHYEMGTVQRRVYPAEGRPTLDRGLEMGWFNWGSAIVLVTDLPDGVVPCVREHDEVRVGQALCAPQGSF